MTTKSIIKSILIVGVIFFIYNKCTSDDKTQSDGKEKETDTDTDERKLTEDMTYYELKQYEADRKADIQQAINDGDFSLARKRVSKLDTWDLDKSKLEEDIDRAEITFLINSGSIEPAYNVAQENDRADIFSGAFMAALSEVYDKVGKVKTLQYLTKVDLGCTPDLSAQSVDYENSVYNESATKYNMMLEQFIVYVDILNDKEFATQLLRLVKPIVVELPKQGDKYAGVKLSNQPQEDIKEKLGL